jgi:hypothetical protein
LGCGDVGGGSALAELIELGLGRSDLSLGAGQAGLIGLHQRVELLLGVGHRSVGLRYLGSFLLTGAIVAHLGLLDGGLGVVQRRLSLNERLVVLLPLGVVELVGLGFAVRVSSRRVVWVAAAVLHILPVLQRGRVAGLGLRQALCRAAQLLLCGSLGG